MKVICISNQKGGVGKTTHANHLAWALLDAGKRVLFVDIDPQGNSSNFFADCVTELPAANLFQKDCDAQGLVPFIKNQLCVLPATGELQNVLGMPVENISFLRNNIKDLNDYFDYAIFDTPPTAGFILKSVIFASDFCMLPMELKQWSVDGTLKMVKMIAGMSREKEQIYGEKTKFLGICINMYDKADKNQPEALEMLKSNASLAQLLMMGEQEQDGEIVKDAIKISDKNVIEHSQNLNSPIWKYNSVQNVIRSKAAVESAREFALLYKYLFPVIGAEFPGLIAKKQNLTAV